MTTGTNKKNNQNPLGMQSFSLAIGIEGGYEGAFASVKAGMKASASMKQERSFFSSGEGMMLISEARCITYMMSVNKIIPPKVVRHMIVIIVI